MKPFDEMARKAAPQMTDAQWRHVRSCAALRNPVLVLQVRWNCAYVGPVIYNGPARILIRHAPWPEDMIEALGPQGANP